MTNTPKLVLRVTCVDLAPTRGQTSTAVTSCVHTHIAQVGLSENGSGPVEVSVREARSMIENGYLLYTVSPSSGKTALIHPFTCPCGVQTLRSNSNAGDDMNIDRLPHCG